MATLKVGQKVRALHDVFWPPTGIVAKERDIGEIVGVGLDAQFGFVQVRWPGQTEREAIPVRVGPAGTTYAIAELVP